MIVKIFLSFVVINSPLVQCNVLNLEDTAVAQFHSPVFYVSEWIRDWNSKSTESNDVVMMEVGDKSDLMQNLASLIISTNPIVSVDVADCTKIQKRKSAFVIIASNVFKGVSSYEQ
jgi:hypothetical protein